MKKKVLLIILDGWGEGKKDKTNAIYSANVPFIKSLYNHPDWKYVQIEASGEYVGLPQGQMGNSEVGHLNIGAGRIIYQDFVRINKSIENKTLHQNPVLLDALKYALSNNKPIHYLGLVSDGGVHSSTRHLEALCLIATEYGIKQQFVHVLTDGRDTDPHSGIKYVTDLDLFLRKNTTAQIATICGRYFTMDRDKRWDRIKKGYDLMVHGIGHPFSSAAEAILTSYSKGITDEFIEPSFISNSENQPIATIKPNEVVICFNFRTDRLREITTVLTQKDMPEYKMYTLPLYYITMTRYDETFRNVHVLFDNENIDNTLGQIISEAGFTQLRIAETEKYPHVTFFFSGGREEIFENERRILIPSPKVATYDLQPEMSAIEIKNTIIPEIQKQSADFICLNFANADMVGHTGVYDAIIHALETVDQCVSHIVPVAIKANYSIIITSDHGNADQALNEDGSPNTAHTTNPVPFFIYHPGKYQLKSKGILANIAPTILEMMNIPIPSCMLESLFINQQ